jgi:hypothetical protein
VDVALPTESPHQGESPALAGLSRKRTTGIEPAIIRPGDVLAADDPITASFPECFEAVEG